MKISHTAPVPKLDTPSQKPSNWWKEYRFEIAIVAMGLASVNAIFISKAFRQSTTINS